MHSTTSTGVQIVAQPALDFTRVNQKLLNMLTIQLSLGLYKTEIIHHAAVQVPFTRRAFTSMHLQTVVSVTTRISLVYLCSQSFDPELSQALAVVKSPPVLLR